VGNLCWRMQVCKHKPLFSPFDHSDTLIAIITLITIMLAAPAGIGGGGILVCFRPPSLPRRLPLLAPVSPPPAPSAFMPVC
jgi:hypothetical protein